VRFRIVQGGDNASRHNKLAGGLRVVLDKNLSEVLTSMVAKLALGLILLATGSIPGPNGMATDASVPPLVLEQTIPLENVTGRIDHMAVEPVTRRLVAAELGNHSVDVVDLTAGRVVGRIGNLNEPQGVAYESESIVVASAGDGTVRFFGAQDLRPLGAIDLGEDADNIRIDRTRRHLIVGYGDGGLAIIDPVTRA
jgi:hypothetical protein